MDRQLTRADDLQAQIVDLQAQVSGLRRAYATSGRTVGATKKKQQQRQGPPWWDVHKELLESIYDKQLSEADRAAAKVKLVSKEKIDLHEVERQAELMGLRDPWSKYSPEDVKRAWGMYRSGEPVESISLELARHGKSHSLKSIRTRMWAELQHISKAEASEMKGGRGRRQAAAGLRPRNRLTGQRQFKRAAGSSYDDAAY